MPFFETADGPRLAYEDYGAGAPIVFVSSRVLNAGMWEYQGVHPCRAAPWNAGMTAGPAPVAMAGYARGGHLLGAARPGDGLPGSNRTLEGDDDSGHDRSA
jgi:hypothetical protein